MKLNNDRLYSHILRRLNAINKPQKYLTNKLGIARSTMWRLGCGKDITLGTFFKLVEWLDKDLDYYVIKKR